MTQALYAHMNNKTIKKTKKKLASQVWWCMTEMPALGAEEGGLRVQGQPGLHSETLSQNKQIKNK
jgi:hypothetical protein